MAKPAADNPLIIQSKKPGICGKLLFILQLLTMPFLFVIRSILVVTIIMLAGFTCFILTLGTKRTEPLGRVRKFLVYGSLRFYLRLFMYSLGIHVRVKGKYNPEAKLIVSNHTSILDGFCGPIGISASPIAKKIDTLWPIRQICNAARAIILNRDFNKKQQQNNNLQVRQQIKDHIERFNTPIIFFPGGSIVDPRYNLAFKPFCFTLDQKMQVYTYQYNLMLRIPWTVQSFWALIMQHMMCWGGYVTLTFGPVMERDKQNNESIEDFMKRVMDVYCKMLGNEASEYTVNDIVNFFEIPQNTKVDYSEAYKNDFGWMGTYRQFCNKYQFNSLQKAWGLRAWQLENILPPDQKDD